MQGWYGSDDASSILCRFGQLSLDSRMTAISLCYTNTGFVIAADRRQQMYDSVKGEYIETGEDNFQKIFDIVEDDKVLAYGLMGNVISNDDGSFDVLAEIGKQRERLARIRFADLWDYVNRISYNLKLAFDAAWKDGRIDPWQHSEGEYDNLLLRLIFLGYMHKKPSSVQAEFFHKNKRAKLRVSLVIQPIPGQNALAAPIGILAAISHDERFAAYRRSTSLDMTIEDALNFTKSQIEACATPLAAKIDPRCKGIGGFIHVAAVTKNEGFKWLIQPEKTTDTKRNMSL